MSADLVQAGSGKYDEDLAGYMTGTLSGRGKKKTATIGTIFIPEEGRGKGLMGILGGGAAPLGEGRKVKADSFRSDAGEATAKKYLSGDKIKKRRKVDENMSRITNNLTRGFEKKQTNFFVLRQQRMDEEALKGSRVR